MLLRKIITIIKPAFRCEVLGATQVYQEQGVAFLWRPAEEFKKVAKEQAQRIGSALAHHQGIEEQVADKQLF